MPLNIIPYNKANIAADQPWLDSTDCDLNSVFEDFVLENASRSNDIEPCVAPDMMIRADEGDRYAFNQLYPLCHYILTEDYRIVEEPNFFRWGIFLEKAKHRMIDKTEICSGTKRPGPFERHSDAPPLKPQETSVSTVFIGTALNELFETMIFGGALNGTMWRHQTLIDAKTQHWKTVGLAHKLHRYMKQHGKSFRKDWLRLEKMYKFSNARGFSWLSKHADVFESLMKRLYRAPGPPPIPQPNIICKLAQIFIPRE
ncbi:MAG: hypothetical protein WC919_04730 [Candidatus Paceibacterota bacterium]|jgi:hypothetical protein